MSAAKFVYKKLTEAYKEHGEAAYALEVMDVVNTHELWMVDEWTHLGNVIVVCLENPKLVETYKKGNKKILDSLLGKTIKYSNMTVDAELIKELIPLVIEAHF